MKLNQWIFGVLALVLLLGSVWITGIGVMFYIDIPSAIIVYLGGYLISLMSHGPAGIAEAYRTAAGGSSDGHSSGDGGSGGGRKQIRANGPAIARSRAVLKGLGRNFIFLGFFGMIMGLIAVLSIFDPPDTFAQGLATLIITSLYAVLGNLVLVNPFLHRLDAMKLDAMKGELD